MTTDASRKEALLLNFKVNTLTPVSRDTLRRIAKTLGFTETQAVHFALARLREDSLQAESEDAYPPLTKAQLGAIRKHDPNRKGPSPQQFAEMTSHPRSTGALAIIPSAARST